jgi:signal transduction histidine kinase
MRSEKSVVGTGGTDRVFGSIRESWLDIVWVVFVVLNLIAMRLVPDWQTVPFLAIWVSLTAIYGVRLWRMGSTILTVGAVTLATGGLIAVQVLKGQEDAEYLAEVPLLALMFVVMVWHARRRSMAMEEMRRVSDHNARLLDQQRRFLQDASHELRTPITVALGHTELIERAVADPRVAQDARIAVDELLRLRGLADRLLLLASAENPDFLHPAPVDTSELMLDCLARWSHVPRRWSLGVLDPAMVQGDEERLRSALDALIENAVDHTQIGDSIELGVRREGGMVALAVVDSGSGISPDELERIFDRFARVDPNRTKKAGGVGLGLSIAKTVAEAHRGSARVRSTPGRGSAFELLLPVSRTPQESRRAVESAAKIEVTAPNTPF